MRPIKQRGFTLLELLVTVTIIAVLTIIAVVSYASINKRSRDVKRKSDLEQIRSALEMYRSDNSAYSAAGAGGVTDAQNLAGTLVPTYIPAIPADPSTGIYYYQGITTGGVYSSYCLCAHLETLGVAQTVSTCTELPPACNYGLKNP